MVVHRDKATVLAHPEVRALLAEADLRVIAGLNRSGWWLAIEKLEAGQTEWQHWVQEVAWGRTTVSVARDLSSIQPTGYKRSIVSFNALYERRDWLKCSLDTRAQPWLARCDGRYTGTGGGPAPAPTPVPAPPPPPPRPNWAAQPKIMKACGDGYDGSANESACLDVVSKFRYDPSAIIAGCDASMDGDDMELACLRAAGGASFDPSAALAGCDRSMDGDDKELACLRVVADARYHMAAAIAACDAAMDGDDNELLCITAVTRASADPAETIRACDEAMSGDESELDCVKRGLGLR